jgi:hypothetical protein
MEPIWIMILVGIGGLLVGVAFAFWFIPTRGTGNWWKALNWDDRNDKRYD